VFKTGFLGTFVISWSQTEIDGLEAAPVQSLKVGAAWSWRGDTICVDGPNNVLRLDRADDAAQLRRRAARKVQRLSVPRWKNSLLSGANRTVAICTRR